MFLFFFAHALFVSSDIYTCHACGCMYGYPSSATPLPATRASTREVLLRLSRTLNSVIDGDAAVTLEDILRDISRIVPLGLGVRNDNAYEYVCPSWMSLGDKNLSPSYGIKNVPSRAASVNPRFYVAPRYFYEYNSTRSVPLLKDGAKETAKCGKGDRENSSSLAEAKSREPHVRKYLHARHDEASHVKQAFRSDGDSKRYLNERASAESMYPMVST